MIEMLIISIFIELIILSLNHLPQRYFMTHLSTFAMRDTDANKRFPF